MDGRTAGKKAVTVRVLADGLKLRTADGEFSWPKEELRLVQRFSEDEPVRLERGGDLPEVLVIDDPAFHACLHAVLPLPARRFHDPAFGRRRLLRDFLAGVAVLVLCGGVYFWGIPLLIRLLTPHVPLEWEQGLGRSALRVLAPEDKRCRDPELVRATERIVARLSAGQPEAAPFRIIIADESEFNALALPGGTIVVFRGLLEKTGSAEELAGVIAHELQHVRLRHVTRRILSDYSKGFLISAFSGGAAAFGARIAHQLTSLRYSRADENEADAGGLGLFLAAGLDPEAMIRFFENSRDRFELPGALKYISTHPGVDERIARLRRLAAKSPATRPYTSILEAGADWSSLRTRCGTSLLRETGNPP